MFQQHAYCAPAHLPTFCGRSDLEALGASTASAAAAAGSAAVVVAAAASSTADSSNDSSNNSTSSSSSSSDAVEAALPRAARLLEASLRQGAVSANARCRRTGNSYLILDFLIETGADDTR
jgi:hypothetical protein